MLTRLREPAVAAVQNGLHLGGLLLGERRLEDRAAITAEPLGHLNGVDRAQHREDRRVARLDHGSGAFYERFRDAELVLPPTGVERAARRAESAPSHGSGGQRAREDRATGPGGERDRN